MSLLAIGILVSVALVAVGLVLFTALIARRVERILPACGQFIEIDGTRLHYLDKGQGPAIMMIHGLSGQLRNFTHSLLDRLVADFRVILIDRPGSGYSTLGRSSARLSAQGQLVAELIRALGLKQPLLVGHSLGGAVALSVALENPGCVGGLALIAPLTHWQETVPAPFRSFDIRSKILRRIVAWTVATPAAMLAGKAILKAVFTPDSPPPDFPTKGGGLLTLRPSSFFAASSDMVAISQDLPNMIGRYSTLTVPIAILFGTEDPILNYQTHGEAMKHVVATSDLELISGGHMLPVSASEKTADWIGAVARKFAIS
jgi:pimeloyl-ACP methyl ester carboxylesterase